MTHATMPHTSLVIRYYLLVIIFINYIYLIFANIKHNPTVKYECTTNDVPQYQYASSKLLLYNPNDNNLGILRWPRRIQCNRKPIIMHKITNLLTEHGYRILHIIKIIKQVKNTEIHIHRDNEIHFHIYVLPIVILVLFNKQCIKLYHGHFRDKKKIWISGF